MKFPAAQRLAQALHLQPEFGGVDAEGTIDRQYKSEVDIAGLSAGGPLVLNVGKEEKRHRQKRDEKNPQH
jgi:hypothetical protein